MPVILDMSKVMPIVTQSEIDVPSSNVVCCIHFALRSWEKVWIHLIPAIPLNNSRKFDWAFQLYVAAILSENLL